MASRRQAVPKPSPETSTAAASHRQPANETSSSPFQKAHLRFRRQRQDRSIVDDLDEMIDFSRSTTTTTTTTSGPTRRRGTIVRLDGALAPNEEASADAVTDGDVVDGSCHRHHHRHYYTGPVFGLEEYPGFLFAPQALSCRLQQRLAHAAVTTYCEGPHATNIQAIPPKPTELLNSDTQSMWELWKQESCPCAADTRTEKQDNILRATSTTSRGSSSSSKSKYYRCFQKLSWATMGYHYDWTERCYHRHVKSPMPAELERLGELFARTAFLLSEKNRSDDSNNNNKIINNNNTQRHETFSYTASASIVNYYNQKSNMGGHRDDLELALDKPIVSISMGQPAVFLLGGKSKQDEPVVPIVVRPGDVLVMGGACRLNYHSMCRLLLCANNELLPTVDPDCCPQPEQEIDLDHIFLSGPSCSGLEMKQDDDSKQLLPLADSPQECEALDKFLATHRININLRQVYPDD